MSSDRIVVMIDEEIERLRKLRAIFVSLLDVPHIPKAQRAVRPGKRAAQTSAVPKDFAEQPVVEPVLDAAPASAIDPVIVRLPAHEPRHRRPREPKPVEQPLALRGTIPSSPGVVRPAVSKPVERAPELPAAIEPGSFAALVRTAERELQTIA